MRPLRTWPTVTSAIGMDNLKAKEQKSALTHNQAIARVWVGASASVYRMEWAPPGLGQHLLTVTDSVGHEPS